MDRVDFIRAVAEQSLPHLERIVSHFLPNGEQQGREYTCLNPTRADNRLGSFSINLDTGQWADFATGDKGSDAVSLVAYLDGGNQGKAAEAIANLLGNSAPTSPRTANTPTAKADWTPLVPIPEDAPEPPNRHYKHGEPSQRWAYCNADGEVVCYVCRFETTEGKTFKPLTFCESSDGRRAWHWKGLLEPRPLYHSDLLKKYPEAIVITCEGEKAADAAATLFPLQDYVTTTALNGAQSPGKTDWTPLAHRTVWIWPDNDKAGRGFADAVCKLIRAAQQEGPPEEDCTIHEIRLDGFKRRPDGTERELPPKWDAADAVAEGFTAEHINSEFLADPANIIELRKESAAEAAEARKGQEENGFKVVLWEKGRRNGVYFQGEDDDSPRWICDPLLITAQCRDDTSCSWGRLLEFNDPAEVKHAWAMPMRILAGDGTELRQELLDQGLTIAPGRKARELLTTYIQTARPTVFARCTERTGWYRGAFVLPDEVFGEPEGERVLFQTSGPLSATYGQAGTVEDWRNSVAALCIGNSRLVFAVSTAFASPLLWLVEKESGGVHFRGQSSGGKTTTLRAAASVFGHGKDFVETWRATDNGLEGIAAAHNDGPLILDEIGQVESRIVGEIIYMLANGQGKGRANRQGMARLRKLWRLLFLSSGEHSLADHMKAAGKRAMAGQETRLIDIPADTCHYGAFEQLHGYATGSEFAQALSTATQKYYGTPSRAFLCKLTSVLREKVTERTHELIKIFVSEYVPAKASGQVIRIAERFALIAAGGELATVFGITGWKEGDAIQGAKTCFDAAIDARGGHSPREETAALEQVRLFFEQHGESRFTPWNEDQRSHDTINRAGFKRVGEDGGIEFYVLPETFKAEICKGLDAGFVARLLAGKGLLYKDSEGNPTIGRHLPVFNKTTRVYHFKSAIL